MVQWFVLSSSIETTCFPIVKRTVRVTVLIRENIQHKSRYWHINGFIYSEQIIPGYSLSVNTSQQSIITCSPHLGHIDQVMGENNIEDNQLTLISIDGQFYRLWWYSTYHKQYSSGETKIICHYMAYSWITFRYQLAHQFSHSVNTQTLTQVW